MSTGYHEPASELSPEIRDQHRALATLIEELEAVDWYNQRASVTTDAELKAIQIHHRDEEIEHAAMAIEWLRRTIPKFDAELREYLFTEQSITHIEEGDDNGNNTEATDTPSAGRRGSLGLGQFKKGER